MKRRFFILILALTFGCTNNNSADTQNEDTTKDNPESSPKPTLADFSFVTLEDQKVDGESLKGQPVFMHFWATWCKPCIQEMPTIVEAMDQVEDVQFVFPSDESLSKIKKFQETHDFDFNYVQMPQGFTQYQITTLPTTIIFDKNGEVVDAVVGSNDWSSEEEIMRLKKLAE